MKYKIISMFFCFLSFNFLSGASETVDKVAKNMINDWHFEIFNKSGKSIKVTFDNNNISIKRIIDNAPLTTEQHFRKLRILDIDPTLSYQIVIKPEGSSNYVVYNILENDKRKNIFLTWDGVRLRPQTGVLKGLLGKTDSGLPLKGNVVEKEIFRVGLY